MATKKPPITTSKSDDDTTGSSGQTGHVQFRDFISNTAGSLRDDLLPVDEIKRLIIVHQDKHKNNVIKQKALHDQREKMKQGKISLADYREGLSHSTQGQYKAHPAFENSPQFHDAQVNIVPTEFIAQTNDELRNKLEYDLQLKLNPELAYENRLTSTPKLTRS